MFDFEHPFARNGLPTLGEWYQGPNVVDNKRMYYFHMAISHFFSSSPFNASFTAFEIFLKKLSWPIPLLWWPTTNHKATPYVVFGAFIFVHIIVVHSNLHLVMEQIPLPKKSLMYIHHLPCLRLDSPAK